MNNFILHPDASWIRIDEHRIQLRQPDGKCVTFDKFSNEIELILNTLKDKKVNENTTIDEGIEEQIKNLLFSRGLLVDPDIYDQSQILRLINQYAVTGTTIQSQYRPKNITLLGEGRLFTLLQQKLKEANINLVPNTDKEALLVAVSDQENYAFSKEANRTAIDNKQPILFVQWAQSLFKIGPFVIPHETACLDCAYEREHATSLFPDELLAYRKTDISQSSTYEGGPVLDDLISALVTRQILAIFNGNVDLSAPSIILTVDPVKLSTKHSFILHLPRCGTCGTTINKPQKAVRDTI
jgi:bacteriocin biosynthesis cyclodehydratase domain-containing protein